LESNQLDPISPDFNPNAAPVAAPTPSLARRIFFGPFGLRAGWGILLYILIIFAMQRTVNAVHHHVVASQTQAAGKPLPPEPKPDPSVPQPVGPLLIAEAIVAATVVLVSWLMALIERRRAGVYGLGGQRSVRNFLIGALWGLIALSLLVALLRATHVLIFDAQVDHGPAILGWGITLLFGFFLVGVFEELLFRGYLQFTLTRGFIGLGNLISPQHSRAIAFWIAAVITSAFFFIAHTSNAGEDKMGLVAVFLAGMVFVVALWRTGSLWWALGFHMSWDWAQSFLYGVPDSGGLMQGRLFATHAVGNPLLSGGTVGPEGSVLIIPVLCLVLVVLLFTKRSPQPPLELPSPQSAAENHTVIA